VTVLFAEVFNVASGGLKDRQAEESQYRDQREVASVSRVLSGGEQRLELQMRQSQGRCEPGQV